MRFTNVLALHMYSATKRHICKRVTRLQKKMSKRRVLRFDLLQNLNIKNILQLGEYDDINYTTGLIHIIIIQTSVQNLHTTVS